MSGRSRTGGIPPTPGRRFGLGRCHNGDSHHRHAPVGGWAKSPTCGYRDRIIIGFFDGKWAISPTVQLIEYRRRHSIVPRGTFQLHRGSRCRSP